MTTKAEIVAIWRSWLGTPLGNGATKGKHTRCAGWLIRSFDEAGLPELFEAGKPYLNAGIPPGEATLRRWCEDSLVQALRPAPGQIALCEAQAGSQGLPWHLAGLVSATRAIHCDDQRYMRVVEDQVSRLRPLAFYDIPGLDP